MQMSAQSNVPAKVGEQLPRWREPMDLVEEMQTELARLWGGGRFDAWPFGRPFRRLIELHGAALPRADVFEQNGNVVVKAELPGVKKEDVEVEIEDGDLVIRAERKAEQEVKEEDYYRMERSFSLYRRLPLPEGVETDRIAATLADGVLEVKIPKPAAAPPKAHKIAVR
jgi:HSP20 family protein